MTQTTLDTAIREAERFLERAKHYRAAMRGIKKSPLEYTKESAAAKRASMDLTRALADLRQGR